MINNEKCLFILFAASPAVFVLSFFRIFMSRIHICTKYNGECLYSNIKKMPYIVTVVLSD